MFGRVGVVLQTKCRTAPGSNVDRERRWIRSAVNDAARQAAGTLRTLRSAPQTMTSLRGVPHEIVADRFDWLSVIIIDHDTPPPDLIVDPSTKHPAIVLLKSDWDFLFNHLRSTFAVVRYLRHAVQFEAIELGTEWIRYGHFAFEASLEPESTIDPRLLIKGAVPYHSPLLSLTPATEDDGTAQAFYRMILDEVALIMMSDPDLGADARLDVLAELDALPVSMRSAVARYILDSITELSEEIPEGVKWLTRTIRGTADGTQLMYGACSMQFEGYRDFLQSRLIFRHHDLRAEAGPENCQATLAIILTPRRDGTRPWDVTICRIAGEVEIDAGEAQAKRDFWEAIRVEIPKRAAARSARRHRRAQRKG